MTISAASTLPRWRSPAITCPPAVVQPIRLLAVLHVPRAALDKASQQWHKGKANAPLTAREHVEGPGFCQELLPGLRLSSVREQDTAIAPWCGHSISIRYFVTATSATAFDLIRQNRQTRPDQIQHQHFASEKHGERF